MWRLMAGFGAGCGGVVLLPALPSPGTLCAICAVLVAVGALARFPVALALAFGLAYATLHAQLRLADRLDARLEGRVLELRGAVVSVPQGDRRLLRFRFAPANLDLPRLLELTWYDATFRPRAGERLSLQVKLRRPRGLANPGGADNDARMLREGIGASGYVRAAESLGRRAADAWRHPVLVARGAVAEAVQRALGDRPAGGIVAGLSVGLQDALSRTQWQQLARTGTSHLMAISGLHNAMVAAIAAWSGARVQRWRQRRGATGARRDAAVLAGTLAAVGYSLLAGWSVPTQRTLWMIVLAAWAVRTRRQGSVVDGYAACVGGVLLLDPLALLAPGFWLSFGAVAAILLATAGHVRAPGAVRSYLAVQLAVTVGLVPVLVGSFGQLSLVAALVNLAAIPLYTLLIVPAVLVASAMAVAAPAAGDPALRLVAALIDATWPLFAVPAQWPHSSWAVAGLPPAGWLAMLVGVLAALLPLPLRGRLAGAVIVVALCGWRPERLPPSTARVEVLDVGQGLAVFVETRHHALLFDAGPSFRSGTDAGQLVLLPYLRYRGVDRLDVLVASHDDDDHKGGAGSVLDGLPVRAVVAGPSIAELRDGAGRPVPLGRCRRGERWTWDGVRFSWVHPGAAHYERDNDSSCVLLVEAGEHRTLLTGDVEGVAEGEIVARGLSGPLDLVVAPHHGSRTSSTPAFVAAVRPDWVVFTVGYRNRWGFPARPVVERWRAAGARTIETSASGAVEFVTQAGRPLAAPRAWRSAHHRFWHDP